MFNLKKNKSASFLVVVGLLLQQWTFADAVIAMDDSEKNSNHSKAPLLKDNLPDSDVASKRKLSVLNESEQSSPPITSPSKKQKNEENQENGEIQAPTEEQENADTKGHRFGLSIHSQEVGKSLDSRAFHRTLRFKDTSFEEWHTKAINDLRELTQVVRKKLYSPEYRRPSYANLLKYRADLFLTSSSQGIEIENNQQKVWISGWPTGPNQEKIMEIKKIEKFKDIDFNFISSHISNFENLTDPQKSEELLEHIRPGYCIGKHSYLIKERLEYQDKSLRRAEGEIGHFREKYLHTEQGLMLYLSSEAFENTLLQKIQEQGIAEDSELSLVINLVSSKNVCLNCADRLFRESEWAVFLDSNPEFSKYKFKVHFFASAYEAPPDSFLDRDSRKSSTRKPAAEAISLLERYNNISQEEKNKLGFDSELSKIDFMKEIEKRQEYDPSRPFIGHADLSQKRNSL